MFGYLHTYIYPKLESTVFVIDRFPEDVRFAGDSFPAEQPTGEPFPGDGLSPAVP